MEFDHLTLVSFAKSGGLFYFIAMSVGVLIYALRPANRKRFDRAKYSILDEDDQPGTET